MYPLEQCSVASAIHSPAWRTPQSLALLLHRQLPEFAQHRFDCRMVTQFEAAHDYVLRVQVAITLDEHAEGTPLRIGCNLRHHTVCRDRSFGLALGPPHLLAQLDSPPEKPDGRGLERKLVRAQLKNHHLCDAHDGRGLEHKNLCGLRTRCDSCLTTVSQVGCVDGYGTWVWSSLGRSRGIGVCVCATRERRRVGLRAVSVSAIGEYGEIYRTESCKRRNCQQRNCPVLGRGMAATNALSRASGSGSRCPPRSRHTLRSGTLPCEGTAEVLAKARARSPPSRNPSSAAGAGNAPISCTRSFGRRGHSISSATHVGETSPTPCHAYCSL